MKQTKKNCNWDTAETRDQHTDKRKLECELCRASCFIANLLVFSSFIFHNSNNSYNSNNSNNSNNNNESNKNNIVN